ncbi:unnamed protein product [Lathyrus sativus]|nr:unnamed protein product [Lathyrus sativus]
MKDMCETLKLFAENKDILSLQTKSVRVSHRAPSTPMFNEPVMVGRKDDQEKLMNMLLSESNTCMDVLAIVGMGGVGKTTLAQLAYNDEKVQKHFDLTAWACVSEDFDVVRVTKNLLESVTKTPWETNNLDLLRVELKKNLNGRRFFIVLDDLWNDNHCDWEELVSPLIYGKNGSKVIITTRNKKVADAARTFPIFELDPLSHEDSWSLLSKHAFGSGNFSETQRRNLEAIGRKIARKSGGLPIAAKTLGGLLRSKVDTKEWIEVFKSDIWNLQKDNILPALRLSYQYLSSQLKRCFSYCSIFPKDYSLDREQLVLLWMAEGFLDHSQDGKTMEEVGDECFTELLSRSLIQQLHDDINGQIFVLHDLVNDLATAVSGKTCYRLEFGAKSYENVRHLSYNQEFFDIFKKFQTFHKFKCLRSLLAIGSRGESNISRKVVDDLLPTFGRLRVLSLSKYRNIATLPVTIGNLVQLRYLNLSHTYIASLPDTICNLYYLQTLILSCCSKLTELPEHVGKLINLRHLYIDMTSIIEMPKQIAELENLQTLNFFVVGKKNIGLSVRELGKFPKLRGKVVIKNLQNVIDVMEASDTNLKSKEHIEELTLQWGEEVDDSLKGKEVLNKLQPSPNLKKLSIDLYGGTSFPSWLGDASFSNMVSLCIDNCMNSPTLPPLGQLASLKDLHISRMTLVDTIGQEFYGMAAGSSSSPFQPFSSLEKLVIEKMSNWKEWLPFQDNIFPFPLLNTLELSDCPELRGHLPSQLPSIEKVIIDGCDHLLATPPTQHWLSSIKSIYIEGDSYSESNIERTQCSLLESDSPCLLQDITITSCHMLKFVPKMIINSTCLRNLTFYGISSLTAFPTNSLPTSLQSLYIEDCENLTFLPLETWSNYTSLESLHLDSSCSALTSFRLNCFPMLQHLSIRECRSLESIFISETSSCSSSTLQSFYVYGCKELRSLPQRMDTLTSLESLSLSNLPNLNLSLCEGVFLPPNLQSIHIESVRITKPVTEWGFQSLTVCSSMSIGGDDNLNMLLKEPLLPISLVSLYIIRLSEMKSLEGNGLGHLSSLENLLLDNCSELVSVSEITFPSSLKSLSFGGCPRLEPLLEDNLPTSFERLFIQGCPLLEERYKREEHWSKIAHIPVIEINGQLTI